VKPTPYVDEASAALAHAWQERIQKLPAETGVIFISVSGIPSKNGKCEQFDVVLGIKAGIAVGTAMAVVQHYFATELEQYGIGVTIYQGVEGPGHSESHPGPGQHPAGQDDSV
jgi:hypothetical protein